MSDFRIEGEVVVNASEQNIDQAFKRISSSLKAQLRTIEDITKGFDASVFGGKPIPTRPIDAQVAAVKRLEKEVQNLDEFFKERRQIPPPDIKAFIDRVNKAGDAARTAFGSVPQVDQSGAKGFLTGISNAIENADKKLQEFGFSFRGISILAGAGLAGGIVGVVRILEKLGTKAIEVGQDLKKAIDDRIETTHQLELAFGSAASRAEDFSQRAVSGLGLADAKAKELLLDTQQFFTQLEIGGTTGERLGEILTTIATEAFRTVPGFKDVNEALKSTEDAVSGSEEAIKRLLGPDGLEAVNSLSLDKFHKNFDRLSEDKQQLVLLTALNDKFAQSIEQLGARGPGNIERVKEAFGSLFGFIEQTESERRIENLEAQVKNGVENIVRDSRGLAGALGFKEIIPLSQVLKNITDAELQVLLELAPAHSRVAAAIQREVDARNKNEKAQKQNLSDTEKELVQRKKAEELFLRNSDLQQKALDANQHIIDAQIEGDRRVQDAEEQLARVREDNARKREDLELRNERTITDAHIRLNRALQDAEISQAERELKSADREQKFEEAKLKIKRDERTARERLDDFIREHNRRIDDDERRLHQARVQRAQQEIESLISVFEAQLKFDTLGFNRAQRQLEQQRQNTAVQDAERKLRQDRLDDEIKLSRLKRDERETEADGIRALRKAERDRQEAILQENKDILASERSLEDARKGYSRAIEDAARALDDLEVQQNRALFDAKKRIREAEDARDKAVRDAREAFKALADEVGILVDRLHELVDLITVKELEKQIWPKFATGVRNFSGGLAVVGEKGPELVNLPRGSDVLTNRESMNFFRELANSAARKAVEQHVTINQVANDPDATAFAVAARLAQGID